MSWNSTDLLRAAGRVRAFFKPVSITVRLTWLYTLTAFSMLVVYGVFMYSSLVTNVARANFAEIDDQTQQLVTLIRSNPAFLNHYAAMIGVDATGHFAENAYHHSRVLDEAGHVIAQSPGFDRLVLPLAFPAAAFSPGKSVNWTSNGRAFLLKGAMAQEMNDPRKLRIIQVVMDTRHNNSFIAAYHKRLIGALIVGIFVCAGIGFSVARESLQPLGLITASAERITVAQIAARLDTEHWPTELRNLAVAFNSMLDRLEQSIVRLSQFSSDLAHELRTPINNLIGEAEIVVAHNGTPEEFRHTVESSLEELSRLSRVIDTLLFLARAENPNTRIDCSRFDLYGEVHKLCSFYEWSAEEQGVTLTWSGSGIIAGEQILVNRAISNLISNALKYTSSPGKVEVTVRQLADLSAEITVRDTGLGIEQKDLPYIFDRFFRTDGARSTRPQGTGLGLSIVKSIMDLHGGAIDIQSEPGLGTAVTLRFTSHQDSSTPRTPPSIAPSPSVVSCPSPAA